MQISLIINKYFFYLLIKIGVDMIKLYFYLCFTLFLLSCAQPVQIIEFNTNQPNIKEGETSELWWIVKNADTISVYDGTAQQYIYLGQQLQNKKIVKPQSSTEYNLTAVNKSSKEIKSININVEPRLPQINKPVVKEEANESASKYLAGLKNIKNVFSDSKLVYRILSFDRTHYPDSIFIKVIVQDEKGNFVSNLAPPYGEIQTQKQFFKKIIENVEQEKKVIDDFSVIEFHNQFVEPCNFSLVLDHSGSMYGENGEPIKALENSTKEFISKKRLDDKLSVVKFDHRVFTEVPLTSDENEIRNRIQYDGLKRFGGATALYAAGDFGLKTLNSVKNNKYLILFTDGMENASLWLSLLNNSEYAARASELIYNARDFNTKIYTIGFGYANQKVLEKMAVLGDGAFYWANNGKEIEQIYSELPRVFQNYYLISYKPMQKDGYHEIVINGSNLDGSDSFVKGTTYIGEKFDFPVEPGTQTQVVAFFDFNDATLKPEYKEVVKLFVKYLNTNSSYKIKVIGHTDLTGPDGINKMLSLKRAQKVASVFVENGINKTRIEVIGMGKKQPIHTVENYQWQANENRRVELVIYEK
jgi:outer membrane protein OmpA-like peptidoglycan-associated protein